MERSQPFFDGNEYLPAARASMGRATAQNERLAAVVSRY